MAGCVKQIFERNRVLGVNNKGILVMSSVAIIVLNYMTWEETLKEVQMVKEIVQNKTMEYEIIVIDNCSSNDSYEQLSEYTDEFTLIKSSENRGYAAGNNIGLRYAYEKNFKYSWILNNDILFTDKNVINEMLKVFENDEDIAIVSPDIYSPSGYMFNRDAVRPSLFDMTLGLWKYKKRGRAIEEAKKGWLYVYRPQGCCMLVDNKKASAVGYMDENTFLYCEEIILAERLLNKGYKCACCSSTSVIHNHSYTVKKTLSKINYIKTNIKSFDYYLKKYRKYGFLSRILCRIFYIAKLLK